MAGLSIVTLPKYQLLTQQTSANVVGLMPPSLTGQYVEATYYIVWNHTSAAGAVVVETAHDPTYAGTWANLGTANWATIDTVSSISVSGVYGAVRVRISSAVTSGAVDVYAIASSH